MQHRHTALSAAGTHWQPRSHAAATYTMPFYKITLELCVECGAQQEIHQPHTTNATAFPGGMLL